MIKLYYNIHSFIKDVNVTMLLLQDTGNIYYSDKIALFRDIVSGRCIPSVYSINSHLSMSSIDRYYQELNFEFETVSYISTYTYCLCLCGYEHEYATYISDSGEIDKEIYERVVQNIVAGKCPHVDSVPKGYVNTACINAMHIAVAVNKTFTLEKLFHKFIDVKKSISYTDWYYSLESHLSGVDPYHIAIMKNNTEAISAFPIKLESISKIHRIYYAEKLGDDKLRIEFISVFQLCILRNKTNMVSCRLSQMTNTNELGYVTCNDISEALKCNISNIKTHELLTKAVKESSKNISELAIFWNRPSVLVDTLADVISKESYTVLEKITRICVALQRHECLKVIINHGVDVSQFPDFDRFEFLLDLLITFDAADAVIPVLKKVKDATESKSTTEPNNNKLTHLYKYNDRILDFQKDISVLKVLLQFCDVNYVNEYGFTPFLDLLERLNKLSYDPDKPRFRQAVELYIYENSDLAVNTAAVTLAVDLDKKTPCFYECAALFWEFCRNEQVSLPLTADGKTHALYGHDEDDGNFALNFYAPLLVECGYPLSEVTYDFQESLEKVHPMEKVYLQDCFNVPRALRLCCRDSLRRHFKGRQIHKFVERSSLPRSVADYILLKPLLKCVPKNLLD